MNKGFLASMSHELRTPINAILGFTELLREGLCGSLTPEQEECINGIAVSGKHLLKLVNDVYDITNIEGCKPTFYPTMFNVAEAIQEVLKTLRPLLEKDKITASCTFSETIDTVYLDKDKFVQVLYNLLSNAIKFNRTGGIIRVATEDLAGESFSVHVTDNGIGIMAEDISSLFIPFTQLNKNCRHRGSGSGLGLAITKGFVQLQGGFINVKSRIHEGSTFSVTLPKHYQIAHGREGVAGTPIPRARELLMEG